MSEEPIVNRVAQSALINIDLEELPPKHGVVELDLVDFLGQGLVLREAEFRTQLKSINRALFDNAYVRVFCSTQAIIPAWAYQLVAVELSDCAEKVLVADRQGFNLVYWIDHINNLDLSPYKDGLVLLKGCADETIPQAAYTLLAQRLKPLVRKLMFGEACSFIPLHKK